MVWHIQADLIRFICSPPSSGYGLQNHNAENTNVVFTVTTAHHSFILSFLFSFVKGLFSQIKLTVSCYFFRVLTAIENQKEFMRMKDFEIVMILV